MTASVHWRHPRTGAWGLFTGTLITRHRSGRVTVELIVEGKRYLVTGDEG